MDIQILKEGLPYVYVYNIQLSFFDERNGIRTFPMTELSVDAIKEVVEKQQVDVLIFDFAEKVRIKI